MADRIVTALHHVQLAMPKGEEATATAFYVGVLGFVEEEKPAHLRRRGGCWFRSGECLLHLGVETGFRPAAKAHPALVVDDLTAVETRLAAAGVPIVIDTEIEGFRRFYSSDPFGNRLEFLEPTGPSDHDRP